MGEPWRVKLEEGPTWLKVRFGNHELMDCNELMLGASSPGRVKTRAQYDLVECYESMTGSCSKGRLKGSCAPYGASHARGEFQAARLKHCPQMLRVCLWMSVALREPVPFDSPASVGLDAAELLDR